MIGKIIAQYRVVEALGKGGMGSVYKAHDKQLDRMVVLKLLSSELLGNETARRRFLREARLASALDHPNICMIYEIQETDGFYYIAMQYIEGQTLKQSINNRPLAMPTLTSVALQVADALATAHDRGIIHRDIKPQNIMITPRGQAKVLDFGLAKSLNDSGGGGEVTQRLADLTEVGETPGTPAYMSPEQARRERIDRRSDIYSFGIVLYEMATGFKPFTGKDNIEILYNVCNEVPRPVAQLNPEAASALQEILDRSMAKNPAQRYQSMQAMLADLKLLGGLTGGPYLPDGIIKPFAPVQSVKMRWLDRLIPKSLRKGSGSPTSTVSNNTLQNANASTTQPTPVGELSQAATLGVSPNPDDFPIIPGQHKTLAVLPLRSLGNPDDTWSLSFLEALITELAKFKSVTIRPSSYVIKYLNKESNPADVGHELGVDAVIIGSFIGTETKMRVTAQLIDVSSGGILWAGKIDASDNDPIRLQDTICQMLVSQLSGKKKAGSNPFDLLRDESEEIRLDAISTLKFSNDPRAAEALVDALLDASLRVKACAAEALAHFGRFAAPAVLARLEEAIKMRDFATARFAVQAAGRMSSPEMVPMLLDALASDDSFLASEAALALGRLRDERAITDLIEALTRSDANVRFNCAQALGELADQRALPVLEARLREDEDEGVRAKSFWAIKYIHKNNAMVLTGRLTSRLTGRLGDMVKQYEQ